MWRAYGPWGGGALVFPLRTVALDLTFTPGEDLSVDYSGVGDEGALKAPR